MKAVAKIQLDRVEAQLLGKRIGFQVDTEALDWLAKEGFDPQMGARPLKRLIQQVVVNPLARLVLEGRLKAGELCSLRVEDEALCVVAEALQ